MAEISGQVREAEERVRPQLSEALPAFRTSYASWYRSQRWKVAAALSAAVTTTTLQGTAPTSQGQPVWRKNQLEPQLLFGREREGGASLREAASLATPSPFSLFSFFYVGCDEA